MADLREQRFCIKFCFKLGKTAAETHQMLKQAFDDKSLGQTQTYDWYKRFKNGRISTDDDDRSGRPSTGTTPENVAEVRDLILQNRRLTIQDLCNTLGLSYDGTVHKEFVPPGQTVNKEFYRDVLKRLREDMRRKRPEKWCTNDWVLHYDNARPHTAYTVQEILAKNKMAVVPHPPYSPDLAPCDFLLFHKMKIKLKGRRFDTVEEIQAEMQTVLNTLPKKDFQDAFEKWQERWDRCMRTKGDYFEGDGAE
ncbi:hypothetical protein B7P43_G12122 [Cryptotermes secundus]|uniref:Mos1 transposase HTH domain-containing protein n=1 Tax=Cryptotermes secundus TaxID=105785 RepID=A0A2J7PE56_9NEOP|nr:hypothetical protein B7P43_G12122 [Cryptotermes secundus]